jgi:hypothetical protein
MGTLKEKGEHMRKWIWGALIAIIGFIVMSVAEALITAFVFKRVHACPYSAARKEKASEK